MEDRIKKHKNIQPIRMQLRLGNIIFLIILISLIYISCKQEYGELDGFFKKMESNIPNILITDFTKTNIDSSIVNFEKYKPEFVNAFKIVLSDSTEASNIKKVFKSYGIDLVGKQVEWTITASFHKYLNGKEYNIPQILDHMIQLSDSLDEIKYGYLRYKN